MDHPAHLDRSEASKPLLSKSRLSEDHQSFDSLEAHPRPQLKNKGGDWRAPLIILGLLYVHNVAFTGISANLVLYLRTVFHGSNSSNATKVTTWTGTCFVTPLIGAFLADTYWGGYKTIFLSGLIYILGLVIVTISSCIPSLNPPLCRGTSCQSTNLTQNVAFFSGLYLVAFGYGGVLSSLLPFGADQFNDENPKDLEKKESFFIWKYFCGIIGTLTSGTLIVWLEENVNWSLGFSFTTLFFILGFGGFVLGTPTYRKKMPIGSPLKSLLQVFTASFTKMNLQVPADSRVLYEAVSENSNILKQELLPHTDEFRFFDKAAIISNSDMKDGDLKSSWRLCTVTQVEELKLFLRLFPIWATSVLFTAAFSQMSTTFVQQGSAMNAKIGSFSIPPASMFSFKVASSMVWVLINRRLRLSVVQRMALGHFIMILSMTTAACVEAIRLHNIQAGSLISIAWQVPQYFILGGAEIFVYVSEAVLFYEGAPHRMKSLCGAFSVLTIAVGSYLSSMIVGLAEGWLPDDLNKGHLDYLFWSLTGLCAMNFVAFLAFARNYTPRRLSFEK